jgi:hypothetical protein
VEFADHWVKRFFDVMDRTLDAESRRKLMMTNGRTCFREWIEESKQEIKLINFEQWAEKVTKDAKREGLRVEGNVIYFKEFRFQLSWLTADLCPHFPIQPSSESINRGSMGCQLNGNCSKRAKKPRRRLKAPEIGRTSPPGQEENYERYSADDSAAIKSSW